MISALIKYLLRFPVLVEAAKQVKSKELTVKA